MSIKTRGLVLCLVGVLVVGCTSKTKTEPVNTIHFESEAKFKSLDPATVEDTYNHIASHRAYETLVGYHYLKRPLTLEPNLAEAMPEISKDGKTYTFKIKKGVLFMDDPSFKESQGKGRELTADDFVYTIKRIADPKLNTYAWSFWSGKIEGLDAWREEMSKSPSVDYAKPVSGLTATDRYTLTLKLNQASGLFIYIVAMQISAVVPREAVDHYGKDFGQHAVGTGPFRLVEFNPASRIVWEKNPTYRKELYPSEGEPGDKEAGLLADAGKPLPLCDRVVDTVMTETQPMWLSFLSGKLDVAYIPKENVPEVIGPDKKLTPAFVAKGIGMNRFERMDITYLVLNLKDPLIGRNKLLRQALSLAYDSGQAIDLFYRGRAVAAQSPIPPGFQAYDPDFKNPYRQFNVEKAKELLAKAGFPGGKGLPALDYYSLSDALSRQWIEYETKLFAAIGIKLNVHTSTWPEFVAAKRANKGQIYAGGAWLADYPDSENFFQLFYSKNVSPGPNDSNYNNPEFDKLYEKSLTLQDGPERTALYKKLRDLLVEDAPAIWVGHRYTHHLNQPWVKNYKPMAISLKDARYLRIDPALKK